MRVTRVYQSKSAIVPPSKFELMLRKRVKRIYTYTEMSGNTKNGGKVVIDIGGHIYGFVPPPKKQQQGGFFFCGVVKHFFQYFMIERSGSRVELRTLD